MTSLYPSMSDLKGDQMASTARYTKGNSDEPDADPEQCCLDVCDASNWKTIFNKYDTDRDGFVSIHELYNVWNQQSRLLEQDLPSSVYGELLERFDWDMDGKLSYKDFERMMKAAVMHTQYPKFCALVNISARSVVAQNRRHTFMRSYLSEYTCWPPPVFTILITIIQVGIYIHYCVKMDEFSTSGPVPRDSPLIYDPRRRWEAWRFLTYQFIHIGFHHILFNMIMQLMLGIPLEMVHGPIRVCIVYMIGVVGGSLGSSLTDPYTLLAGASGGVYALIAAHLATVILNWSEMEFAFIRLAVLLVFGVTDVSVAIYERYVKDQRNQISYSAHLAGAFVGLFLGIVTLRNLVVQRWETTVRIISFVLVCVFFIAAVSVNIWKTDYYPPAERM